MNQGGAKLRSGPPPDPNALRREKKSDPSWTTLPSEGRKGRPPNWPLPAQTEREAQLWKAFWRKPQAILWQRNKQVYEVALHVRTFVEAEKRDAPTPKRTLVRQQADALLLTIPAMHSARVLIADDDLQPRRRQQAPAQGSSVRDRLKAVQGGGG